MKKSVKIVLIVIGVFIALILFFLILISKGCMDGKGKTWYYPSTIKLNNTDDTDSHFRVPPLVTENAVAYSSDDSCAVLFKHSYHIKSNEKFRLVGKNRFENFINNYPIELTYYITGCC